MLHKRSFRLEYDLRLFPPTSHYLPSNHYDLIVLFSLLLLLFTRIVGKHDFTTFRSVQCQSKSPLKTLECLNVSRDGEDIYIDTSAISYLHHQVRSMVGCLYYIGCGKWTKETLKNALEATDRAALGFNAPPDGLYFMQVDY